MLTRFGGLEEKIVWLVFLQIFNHGPALAAIAFASRALGPGGFGQYARLLSGAAIVTLLIDYGFNLTGVRAAAKSSGGRECLSSVFSAVMGAKLLIAAAILAVAMIASVGGLMQKPIFALGVVVLAQGIAIALTPAWLFIGVQRVDMILLPFAISRVSAALAVVVLVKQQTDLMLFAFINSFFTIILMAWIWKRVGLLGVKWNAPSGAAVKSAIRESTAVFGAGLAINTYTASGPLIVGLALGNISTGQYALADRVRQLVMGAIGPVSHAVFPVACRAAAGVSQEDKALLRKGSTLLCVLGMVAAVMLFALAGPIVRVLGGGEFLGAAVILQFIAILVLPVTLSGILGTQLLVAHGFNADLAKVATLTAVIGVPMLYVLSVKYGLQGIGIALVVTELISLAALLLVCSRRGILTSLVRRV